MEQPPVTVKIAVDFEPFGVYAIRQEFAPPYQPVPPPTVKQEVEVTLPDKTLVSDSCSDEARIVFSSP